MAYKIVIKKRFLNKIINRLTYLELNWGYKVAEDFLAKVDLRLDKLSEQPFIGSISKKRKNVRTFLITKHNRLYYRIVNNTIEIINLYDTRINPRKNIYKE